MDEMVADRHEIALIEQTRQLDEGGGSI